MIETAYADTSSWEEWQREYEYGAFYIFPPAGVIEPIDDLRRIHDPKSDSYCQAHISLSEPLAHPLTQSELEELRARLSSIEPFDMRYGPLRTFLPYPGVAYTITPDDKFRCLRSVIHSTSMYKDATLTRDYVVPHMTVAEFITVSRTAELLQELSGNVPAGTFLCDSIEYAVPTRDFRFARILAIPLGKR